MVTSSAQDDKAANKDGQVEVKNDRFSGNVTVTMKPQALIDTPNHKLVMKMIYRLNQKEAADSSVLFEETASVTFESITKESLKYGDRELHFVVDGKQLPIGQTSARTPSPLLSEKDEKGRTPDLSFFGSLTLSQVERLAAGKQVEMRLGTIELPLSQSTLAAIREFAREFANHAPTRTKKKGAKP
jgi:hypothetical protein